MGILRKTLLLGRKNPNCRYKFDDGFFSKVDTPDKAYLLGWIASDGSITDFSIMIQIKDIDIKTLEVLRDIICKDIPIKAKKNCDLVGITFNSRQMVLDICKLLRIKPGKKDRVIRLPTLLDDLTWHFLRGYFEGDGTVRSPLKKRSLDCSIASYSEGLLNDIKRFCKIPCTVHLGVICFYGNNAINFLENIYKNANNVLQRKYEKFLIWKSKRSGNIKENL